VDGELELEWSQVPAVFHSSLSICEAPSEAQAVCQGASARPGGRLRRPGRLYAVLRLGLQRPCPSQKPRRRLPAERERQEDKIWNTQAGTRRATKWHWSGQVRSGQVRSESGQVRVRFIQVTRPKSRTGHEGQAKKRSRDL
jgi:hypothetical protein